MSNKVSRLAERVVTGLSRRAFLARLSAVPFAAAVFVGEAAARNANCVYLGGCCGGGWPYYDTKNKRCCSDSKCQQAGGICFASPRCCGGAGYCYSIGSQCYADKACITPC
ncbi:MAG TPA: hypothetical protein VFA18_12330 [Gemmataceae bacterium]|nr:hypothetical protein [Gemmataceae bacterium]